MEKNKPTVAAGKVCPQFDQIMAGLEAEIPAAVESARSLLLRVVLQVDARLLHAMLYAIAVTPKLLEEKLSDIGTETDH